MTLTKTILIDNDNITRKHLLPFSLVTVTTQNIPEYSNVGKECFGKGSLHLTVLTANSHELTDKKKMSKISVF